MSSFLAVLFLVLAIPFSTSGLAAAPDPCRPVSPSEASAEVRFARAQKCIELTAIHKITRLEELAKFSDGRILAELKEQYRIVQDLYLGFEKQCSSESAKKASSTCAWFRSKVRNHPEIRIAYLHAILLLQDPEFLRNWVRTMPIYPPSRIVHGARAGARKFDFTFAELAAGHPFSSVAALRVFYEEGLIDPHSKESFPLHRAIINRQTERARYLLGLSVFDLNAVDVKDLSPYLDAEARKKAEPFPGMTPLQHAVAYQNETLIEYLLTHPSVDVNARAASGDTALHFSARDAINSYLFLPEEVAPVERIYARFLADPRVDLNACGKDGVTALNHLLFYYASPYAPITQEKAIRALALHPRFDSRVRCTSNGRSGQESLAYVLENITEKPKKKCLKQLLRSLK
jgi:hypothetical protein